MSPTRFSSNSFQVHGISLRVSEIPLNLSGISLTLSGIPLTLSGIPLTLSEIPLTMTKPCRLVWVDRSSYKYRNTGLSKPAYVEMTSAIDLNG